MRLLVVFIFICGDITRRLMEFVARCEEGKKHVKFVVKF